MGAVSQRDEAGREEKSKPLVGLVGAANLREEKIKPLGSPKINLLRCNVAWITETIFEDSIV